MRIIDNFAKFITFWIPIKKYRKNWRTMILTFLYGYNVFRNVKDIGKYFICSDYSYATKNTKIGKHVRFNGVNLSGLGNISIGDFVICAQGVVVLSDNHNYDSGTKIPYSDNPIITKDVIIDNFVWIGKNALILPGTKIGEGAIIQAGAVVHGEIPPCAIAGGNPAKVFKWRNIEHYQKLKAEGKFH